MILSGTIKKKICIALQQHSSCWLPFFRLLNSFIDDLGVVFPCRVFANFNDANNNISCDRIYLQWLLLRKLLMTHTTKEK